MGSYNYDALHRSAPLVKRAWVPDPPMMANRGAYNIRAMDPPYMNGYGSNAFAMAHQPQMLGGMSHYGHDYGLFPPEDPFANGYGNGMPLMPPVFPPGRTRRPRRERRRRKVGKDGTGEEAVAAPLVRERAMSTSQSPAQSPAPIPEGPTEEPALAGMIFGCTSNTYMECMQMQLFALPAANKSEVMRVAPGTKLFLYNYQARELSGIFEATCTGDMDLEPDAFHGLFPAQVRMRCVERCPNLPLKAFKEAMSENFEKKKNKFKYSLDEGQVRKLVTLFRQELKNWKKQRAQQERKIIASGLQPGLRPGYPSHNEIYQLPVFPPAKQMRMF